MKIILFILTVGFLLAARAEDEFFDTNLAQNAILVERVRLICAVPPHKGLPYTQFDTYCVHVLHIFKNESHEPLGDLQVLAYKGHLGVPKEECTIYLQRYDDAKQMFSTDINRGRWILVGGDATNGVSNVSINVPVEEDLKRWGKG